ncbi:MAG: CDP-glycerol glycerophosphotransferase [Flavobacteriales bacterium]|nr:CDP-glycerol glycerophosphotransferase [Flavobacteriia bacterium]NCP06348.1 CDP-glycerol glycerophosphotransferase [Flavobacteriales bacterium]PIV94608.1 MAG: CDP-glycerol glycerophosphotransferase [Flavobacteriaceae bacterium CG17_big_fil_post_rev_8_21_14_2_50_33_15]PIY11411.1 MAG: CDP-glycerol glycerophosphotransferase [Flavobacteriaceae bacterium CG_4_10_14_3_um_filter_33_47]PJB19174.1 MAG: CDP-glycerol glycerophosphotransferase [Flavobacteriaceae bacterium CG_4_9_14_3_um_filter_33_16]
MLYKFLIYISYSYAIPIGNPLEKEIIKRGYTVKWFSDIDDGAKVLQGKENKLNNIKDVILYNPDIILTITDSVPDFLRGLKVQIFHGFNAEKRTFKKDHFRIRGFFDLYCTQGPSTTSVFKSIAKKLKHFEVIETGWSKVDPLFPITKDFKDDIPTIFIASTFTERLSLAYNDSVFYEIKRLANSGKFNFLMVLHPKIPIELVHKWKSLNNDHFRFYDTTNLISLMKKADIMIADTTSAIQEFGLQGKPTITINHYIAKPYLINITNASQIEETIYYALSYPDKILSELHVFNKELHPYTDGKSSERVISTTIAFLHKNKNYLKKKPLNLIRKYKLRKRLKYFTLKSFDSPFTLESKINT